MTSDQQSSHHPIAVRGDAGVVQALNVSSGSVRDIIGQQTTYAFSAPPADPGALAAAEALLARMPVDDKEPIPAPGRLAPCSYLHQLTPNPLFVGRDAELRALARALRDQPGAVAVTTGIGGVGKTQLAIEVAHRYGPYFTGGVFWISFAEPAAVGTAIARCGSRGLVDWRPDFGQLRPDEQIALVCAAWQSPLPRLLIFDNCEDEELFQQWRPPTGGCRVLVTSRRAVWGATSGTVRHDLDTLARDASVRLLQSYRAEMEQEAASKVAAVLGDLPLALHLAGSFLRRYRQIPVDAYLDQLRTALISHPSLQGRGAERSPTRHELDVARTFALSYNQLQPTDPVAATARALLARAACLAPGEPIPRELLLATLELPQDELDAALHAEDGLQRLIELGLLDEESENVLRLHRLVAAYAAHVSDVTQAREFGRAGGSRAGAKNDPGEYRAVSQPSPARCAPALCGTAGC
ncbi:MAG: NB-ARC domain-containing protein [Oscillochloridaceae bacterium]|nr:NB-ARC domain-containing protein [Chloroflexaceae bacterium]MDW8392189.1 NB-ARC domain-containing protein [Oscillochloridaceae bacterium]